MKLKNRWNQNLVLLGAGLAVLLAGCGKPEFTVTSSTEKQNAPGSIIVPPKVDILFAEDDTGSMNEIYDAIAQQVPAFMNNLGAKNWDFHFALTPLTTKSAIYQVAGSKHDSNWGSQWTPPYPGAEPDMAGMITPSFFRTPDQFSEFLNREDVNNYLNGKEPGFDTIDHALYNRLASSNFLRPDAMLVVVAVSNGEDTSGVTFCERADGVTLPCEDAGYPSKGTKASSFTYYKNRLIGLKPSASQVRFYSAVSPSRTSSGCLGMPAYAGMRYRQMASALGGVSFDVCSQPVSAILDQVAGQLEQQKLQFRTRYLIIAQDANPDTIQVTKFTDGNATAAAVIPQDETNGWTYVGRVDNVYTIDYPANMNLASGYAIELHGTARLIGEDTADVTYKPAGAQDTPAQ